MMKPRDMWKKAADTKDILKKTGDKPRRSSVSGQKRLSSNLGRPESIEDGLSPTSLMSPVDDYCAEKDTDLFVGPVYDDSSRRQNVIKEELGEITKRLHRTLNDFDTLAEFEESPQKKMLNNMSRRISKLENSEMKSELESFLSEYQTLTSTYEEASKERDEILLDLADWFTTDHTDIDHSLGLDESEESDIKKSYVETLADFEKLKRLTESLKQSGGQGKNIKQLKEEKKKLEKSVVAGFKTMNQRKSICIQTPKPRDDTWKHAADEIMSLITNVRTENSAEMLALKTKVKDMMSQLQRQDLQIKGLQSENKREKDLKKQFADENAELNNDIWNLRGKIVRYEKDLESAKKMIEKQFLELAQKNKSHDDTSESVESMDSEGKPSIAGILNQFFGEESEGVGLTRMSSDPIILRTRVRELDGKIDQLAKELVQANDKLEEYEEEFEKMEEQTAELQSENRKLSDKVDSLQLLVEQLEDEKQELNKAKMDAERSLSQLEADSLKPKSSSISIHTCSHCNCHLKSMMSMPLLEEEAPIPLEKKVSDAEIQRLMDKCSNYRRTLAETELKLSNAYKDISEMRLRRESLKAESALQKESASVPSPEPIAEESPEPESVQTAEQGEKALPVAKLREKDEIPIIKKEKPKKPMKPPAKRETASAAPLKKKESPVSLPPLKTPAPLPKEEPPADKNDRELVLWHVGDLQGRLNMVIQEIMDYAKAAGDMLNKEEAEQGSKLPVLTTFEFGNRDKRKKTTKEDPKEAESRQQKAQIVLNGQRAVALMREIYDIMSHYLSLQHDEYELIYRSFKANQHRRMIERGVMLGQLPPSALKEFKEAQEAGLKETCTIVSYGGGGHQNFGPGGGVNQYGHHHMGGPGGLTGFGAGGGWVNPALDSAGILGNEIERQKLEEAVMVLGIQRSKSEVDIQSVMSDVSLPSGTLIRERSSVFMVHVPDSRAAMSRNRESVAPNREEIRVSKTVTPKKGLIKLTSLDYELKNQFVFENKALLEKERNQRKHRPTPQKMLIRRKDIVDQIKAGNKQLMEHEKTKEVDGGMEKQIGEYTFADLQMNIDNMTNKNTRRGFKGKIDPKKQHQEMNKERMTGLPQLNSVKPFGS